MLLGRESMAWHVARNDLQDIWNRLSEDSECKLKRQLWADNLARVYGTSVDQDDLFFQHTYLTIIAKTIAVHVLGLTLPNPQALMEGTPFEENGILGLVESDFFDWPLKDNSGRILIQKIAVQTAAFRLREVKADVLKGLYESLIDPETRHELGEYYTPDWLAEKMCRHVIDQPLSQRVVDPACGSGTFLFHAIRQFMEQADSQLTPAEAIRLCTEKVFGIDIHPVAVQIARVTYLLAIGPERLKKRGKMTVPVYLGDALQWNTHTLIDQVEVAIQVPGEKTELKFPDAITADPNLLDEIISTMAQLSESDAEPSAFSTWLRAKPNVRSEDAAVLVTTYADMLRLNRAGKNHIWGFVARNLVRPLWLSQKSERPNLIIGNPPWLRYSHMSREMQEQFKRSCQDKKIWEGGKVATAQDLSAYFLARCWELYARPKSKLAFVMPHAVLDRRAFEGFRKGYFSTSPLSREGDAYVSVRFAEVWTLPEKVQPLFPVPACVLFCEVHPPFQEKDRRTDTVQEASGILPRRDASLPEAEVSLTWKSSPWPVGDEDTGSDYRKMFHQGATIVPRMLATVVRVEAGMIGGNPEAPLVESRRSNLEKKPWSALPPLRGNVEKEFLRPLYLGESIAPYRALDPVLSVIPWDGSKKKLLNAATALQAGKIHLADWMRKAEALWNQHRGPKSKLDFLGRLDYFGGLAIQFPVRPLRIIYTKAGSLIAACILRDGSALIDHMLYWSRLESEQEGHYLSAIFNSEQVRVLIQHRQARGQWGARHIDKLVFSLPIPRFDSAKSHHKKLAELGARAEKIAASCPLKESVHFITARQAIRRALRESGISREIDDAVAHLLGVRVVAEEVPPTDEMGMAGC